MHKWSRSLSLYRGAPAWPSVTNWSSWAHGPEAILITLAIGHEALGCVIAMAWLEKPLDSRVPGCAWHAAQEKVLGQPIAGYTVCPTRGTGDPDRKCLVARWPGTPVCERSKNAAYQGAPDTRHERTRRLAEGEYQWVSKSMIHALSTYSGSRLSECAIKLARNYRGWW